MAYRFDFTPILTYADVLVRGVVLTIELILVGGVVGVLLGIACAYARAERVAVFSQLAGIYVELIRNTPFIVQLFFIFFGLPAAGVRLGEVEAAMLAMVINLGAYSTEIIRAGIQGVPAGQREAAASLGMTRIECFRHVVLVPALRKIWPALSSQIVIVMLGSSVCSQIAAEELSFAANFIQSRSFRAFEAYLVATAIYLALAIGTRALLKQLGDRLLYGANRRAALAARRAATTAAASGGAVHG
ncbi:polar amino acid ABC transporter permease [Tistrella bauzanensis]|uniref:Polar amino acid ABC transporter permease n=1 Tax=Tistrella bauzanensis TaxID=657419 RepID=A0ABQ1INA6_9PROT|nr:amino acid ABC transporter permease [Tistrella bauzanensis]GGB45727.1 polar amino acid ABC transporter permease [Tistrella bauzanensis]